MNKKPQFLMKDKNGREMFREDILRFLQDELSRRQEERRELELGWTLNANFLSGHQFCEINTGTKEIVDTDREGRSQYAYNRIAPLIETRMANLKQLEFGMTVSPRTSEAEDYYKASISTKILSYLQQSGDFETKRNMLISWSELCGSAFILSFWDNCGGREIGEENGKPVFEGDLKYGLISPYEVYPESAYKQDIDDQRSILLSQVLTSEEIYELYGVEIEGRDIETYALTPVGGTASFSGISPSSLALTRRKAHDAVNLLTYFERPSKRYQKGRLIIAAGEEIVFAGDLPYDTIPLVGIKCKEMPGQFFGRSVIADLIPLQRAYNGAKNKIHDHIKTLAANPLLVPAGTIEDMDALRESGVTPGTVLEYNSERGVPTPLQFPDISDEVRLECESLANEMEYAAGVSQLMVVGSMPSGITSGVAIDKLKQIDSTRLSLSGDNIRDAIRRLAIIWLKIYKKHAGEGRVIDIVGANEAGGALVWSASDINSFDVRFDTENQLKYSEESQKAVFMQALELGLFTDENGKLPYSFRRRALDLMRLGGYSTLLSESELQLQNARRENATFDSALIGEPGIFDDDELHADEHKRYALQMAYKLQKEKDPAAAEAFERHILMHLRRIESKNRNEVKEKKDEKQNDQVR